MPQHTTKLQSKDLQRVRLFIIGFLSFLPLSFVIIEFIAMIFIISIDTTLEHILTQVFLRAISVDDQGWNFNEQDILTFGLRWMAVLSALLAVIKNVFKIDIKARSILLTFFLISSFLHLLVLGRLYIVTQDLITIPIIFLFYLLSLLSLGIYAILSGLSHPLK